MALSRMSPSTRRSIRRRAHSDDAATREFRDAREKVTGSSTTLRRPARAPVSCAGQSKLAEARLLSAARTSERSQSQAPVGKAPCGQSGARPNGSARCCNQNPEPRFPAPSSGSPSSVCPATARRTWRLGALPRTRERCRDARDSPRLLALAAPPERRHGDDLCECVEDGPLARRAVVGRATV